MTSHEMSDIRAWSVHGPDDSLGLEQMPLAPADQGKSAWLMLISCCIIQLPVSSELPISKSITGIMPTSLGFSLVFGIFQEYLSSHSILQGSKDDLAIVGTTSTVLSLSVLSSSRNPAVHTERGFLPRRAFYTFFRLFHSPCSHGILISRSIAPQLVFS